MLGRQLIVGVALLTAAAARPGPAQEPEIRPVATFSGKAQTTGWLPIDLYVDSYVYVRAKVNGQETDVVLDSASSSTVLDAGFANAIHLDRGESAEVLGVGGRQEARWRPAVRIEIGSATLHLPRVLTTDLSVLGKRLGRAMPVIVGSELFHELVVDLDYPRARVALHSPASFRYDGPGQTIDLDWTERGLPAVALSLERMAPTSFTIDTASGNSLEIAHHYWETLDLLEDRPFQSTKRGGGVGGRLLFKVASFRSATLANHTLRNVPASFSPEDAASSINSSSTDGHLGSDVLSRFRMILDSSRDLAHFEAGPGWDTRPFRRDRVGLNGVVGSEGVTVNFVAPNSPADKAGWKNGDRIKNVDGRPVTVDVWRAALIDWMRTPPATEVSFTAGDGRVRTLVTADYY